MEPTTKITIATLVKAPLEKVWEVWSAPEHIKNWNSPSADWHTTTAENDFRQGGKFNYRMEARDKSAGFDFWGIYDAIVPHKTIRYTLGDGRKVDVGFTEKGASTDIIEIFEAEQTHPVEFQKAGWQNILESFRTYTESIHHP